ncbi:hypothetical protein L226DRAFT_211362 [Lentinus tigrinus ALCF2SS1-7]|uniref:DUF6534 domain-containing protein n=1 Tax=Lentinus tigrinus ALCF2SS1-6 TaxID=1328759 RepID=A0A5C2S0E9_9APHY|nr:hypothetical protein L227DRAFT_246829 [Lentinus tigrinus ALCF2SS1-6]RPD71213.1 hypothetical protein L226DRAFT_211362 [Lentinus tigrinus ALCF2SS1-7]
MPLPSAVRYSALFTIMIIPQANATAAGPSPIPISPIPGTLSLPPLPALDNTFGALLIGTFVGLMQFGWTANQCYRYYRTYHEDRLLLKGLVTAVLVLETFHSILCMHISYYYLATNYFKPEALAVGVWSLKLLGVTTGLVILVSQSFFLRRVYLIGRGFRPLVLVVALLLLGEFGFATAETVQLFIVPELHTQKEAWMNSAGVGLAALADTIITAALTYSLHKSRTGFESTDNLIDTLIVYTINTGLLTDVFNIACFIFAIVMPDNLIYAGIVIVASKLYANTLMAVYVSTLCIHASTSTDTADAVSTRVTPWLQIRALH